MKVLLIKLAILALYSVGGGWWLFQKATHLERAAWETKVQAKKVEAVITLASAQISVAQTDARNDQIIQNVNHRSIEDAQEIHKLSTRLQFVTNRLRHAEPGLGSCGSDTLPKASASAGNSHASGAKARWVLPTKGPGGPSVASLAEAMASMAGEADEVNAAYRACRAVLNSSNPS